MDKQNVEGNQEQGTQAQAPVSDQLSPEASTTETALRAELDGLKNELRGLQGKMDKESHRIESNLDKRLEQLGITLTPEQKLQSKVLDLEERLSGQQTQASVKPQTVVQETQPQPVNISQIKQAYPEIDFNSPDVLAAVANNINNEDALLAALGKAKIKQASKPQPTSASVAAPTGRPSNASDVDAIQQEIDNLGRSVITKEGREKLTELRKKLQQAEQA